MAALEVESATVANPVAVEVHAAGRQAESTSGAEDGDDEERWCCVCWEAAPQVQLHMIGEPCCFNAGNFLLKQRNDFWIFVAHIDVTGINIDYLRGDQNAFYHTMRIIGQVKAILKSARLALIAIHRH